MIEKIKPRRDSFLHSWNRIKNELNLKNYLGSKENVSFDLVVGYELGRSAWAHPQTLRQ